ncbi:DNA helicase [Malassezia vespertilionis]|nr:DNA helicase [Malassezia vespertilionis]WFD08225.1 DNA helicase [Malassezia vespertilionis]
MPRRTVFRTLTYLSSSDMLRLLCADPRLRPFVNAQHFAPWRKRCARLYAAEAAYARAIMHEDVAEREEQAFVEAYQASLLALGVAHAPTQTHELISAAVLAPGMPDASAAQEFLVPWILGRVAAHDAFRLLDCADAVELLSLARVFLAVVRITRASDSRGGPSRQYHQMLHVLDADCAHALAAFFAPPPMEARPAQLTAEQQRFVDYSVQKTDLVCVQAFAGTGKTRSLLAYARERPMQRFLYITFNAATARSARAQFPPNVDCRTMHAVALRHVTLPEGQVLGALRPRDVVRLLRNALPDGKSTKDGAQRNEKLAPTSVAMYVLRTLDKYMQSTDAAIRADVHVPKHMTRTTDLRPSAVAESVKELWNAICAGRTADGRAVPCPHDAYVKLLHLRGAAMTAFQEYHVLLLDEAQDLSACQSAILLRARGHCGIIVVGDVHQKIYGFRGGSAAAFHAKRYPPSMQFALTKSFRFGPQVAQVASSILGLKAPPPWHTGEWTRPHLSGTGTDAVLRAWNGAPRVHAQVPPRKKRKCVPDVGLVRHTRIYRTNALLAQDALHCATQPRPPTLYMKTSQRMQDAALLTLFRDAHTLYHGLGPLPRSSPLREFFAWKELVEHVEADDGGGDSKLSLVVSLAPQLASPDFLGRVRQLEQCFSASEDAADVVMTTVHQAKGLEWDTVVVANDFSPVWEACAPTLQPQVATFLAQDELNHMYVALTRARHTLVIPHGVQLWLAALDGLFRFRFAPKHARNVCPLCNAQRTALLQRCSSRMPFRVMSTPVPCPPGEFDAFVEALGCLACLRPRLDADPDLEDFVRWIDGSGVSTASGKLSAAAKLRTTRKAARTREVESRRAARFAKLPFVASENRRTLYRSMLEEKKLAVVQWFAAERAWIREARADGDQDMEGPAVYQPMATL